MTAKEPEALGRATRRLKALHAALDMMSAFASRYDSTVNNVNQIRTRLEEIGIMSDKFEEHQSEVEILDSQSDNIRIVERTKFSEKVCDTKALLLQILEQEVKKTEDIGSPSFSSLSSTNTSNLLKLPAIEVPKFNGDWQQWSSFIESYNAMFHNNSSLAPIHQFHYLRSCLEGQASEVIKSIPTKGENYLQAYETLINRYENKGAIIQAHIRALLNTPKITVASSTELQKIHHHITSNLNALQALGQPVISWDAWLVTLICARLDSTTVGEWHLQYTNKELPKFTTMERFLFNRIAAYEAGEISTHCSEEVNKTNLYNKNRTKKVFIANVSNEQQSKKSNTSPRCNLCAGPHRIPSCPQFMSMTVKERHDYAEKKQLCFNCLYFGHQMNKCRFPPCSKCTKRHHEKLHIDAMPISSSEVDKVICFGNLCVPQNDLDNVHKSAVSNIMLATAVVYISDINGKQQPCRAIIDSGAEISLMTSACVKMLKLPSRTSSCPISGIGMTVSKANSVVTAKLSSSVYNNYSTELDFHILSRITNNIPQQYYDMSTFNIPNSLKVSLADPDFNTPGQIDILLGAETSYDIFNGQRYVLSNRAVLHHTTLGWVIAGKTFITPTHFPTELSTNCTMVNSALALPISKSEARRSEESEVESHFLKTVSRNENGRFVVKLPLSKPVSDLGDSRHMAVQRFFNIEKRLLKDTFLANEYQKFMSEYLALGHMEIVPLKDISNKSYYLPHHAVTKANSLTTKVRVVFDGSAPSNSGVSLNDIMARGPTIQPDLCSILLRFRVHKYVLTGDVEKMYRQVKVHVSDCDLQRIVYRQSPEEPIIDYRLLTVTYGTKSASYLATKCLSQLANDTNDHSVSRAIKEDFYVDDLITGASSEEKCFSMYTELCQVLNSAGMPLRKWCSNSSSLLNQIPLAQNDPSYLLKLNDDETISALGLTWQPSIDSLRFIFRDWSPPTKMTKRTLLSDMNKIFDPVGLLTPVLIKGKIFLQQLWNMKIDWDSPLPIDIKRRWENFYVKFKQIEKIRIPRKVLNTDCAVIELHGFADASQEAFGACVYVKSIFSDHNTEVHLYTSKSRVAPLKQTTIPRLELSGALLLAELIYNIVLELAKVDVVIEPSNIFLWSDSTIVLSWLSTTKPLKVFVSNRVAQISDLTCKTQWRHVPTTCNPADIITRGITVDLLSECQLWWQGPLWLHQGKNHWPTFPHLIDNVPEVREIKLVLTASNSHTMLLDDLSNWMHLIRITAWIARFVLNASIPAMRHCERTSGPLSVAELSNAKTFWLLHAQNIAFSDDLSKLRKSQQVSAKSQLKKLNPFIDEHGLIRVGGRLAQSNLSNSSKFPIVLPSNSRLVRLLFEYEHKRLLHIGPQGLIAHIQNLFWPIRGRILAKSVVHHCLICYKSNPTLLTPLMAPLPRSRVTMERPFARTGVDFCGPIYIRSGIRKVKSLKCYISVFVCFVTRAVHLELVSDLTTNAFMAALFRFMSRRGQCAHIYSDNGTNFIGAKKELQNYFKAKSSGRTIQDAVTDHGIQWHFVPPSAPHFGGLWEAAVKSAKRHLVKMSGSALLNFEEMSTLLCRVEAVLNSRPLTPVSDSPSDYTVLTPGHFLIGGNIMLPPEPDCAEVPRDKLNRWKLIQCITQAFWKRWSTEYLPQLQTRGKWTKPSRKIMIGDLAILKSDNIIVMKWTMVRIVDLHPGKDGVIRVVSVQTSNGTILKRPVVKIALLPNIKDEEDATIEQ